MSLVTASAVGPDPREPDVGHFSVGAFDTLDHPAREIGGDREADAHIAAAARIDRGVDAGKPPVGRHQRAAGIARIDRRVGLDEDLGVARRDLGARKRRARCPSSRSGRRAERIADREHEDRRPGRNRCRRRGDHRQPLAFDVDLEHREIGALVGDQHLGLEFALVRTAPRRCRFRPRPHGCW